MRVLICCPVTEVGGGEDSENDMTFFTRLNDYVSTRCLKLKPRESMLITVNHHCPATGRGLSVALDLHHCFQVVNRHMRKSVLIRTGENLYRILRSRHLTARLCTLALSDMLEIFFRSAANVAVLVDREDISDPIEDDDDDNDSNKENIDPNKIGRAHV